MKVSNNVKKFDSLVTASSTILVLQPDSPDGDSLGSALGLEEILGDLGKTVHMYSYKEPEPYLRTQEGWDRVSQNFPKSFDLTILVDTGAPALIKSVLERHLSDLTKRPFVIIDHHISRLPFGFDTIDIVEPAAAAAEVIAQISLDLKWNINKAAATKLATALLSDSLNLTTPDSTAHSVEMLAEFVRDGANLYEMYSAKREASALTPDLLRLKGKLLTQVQFLAEGKLAVLDLSPDIVAAYKDVYEPYTLVLTDMQWTKGVELAAVFKNYGTKINVPLRSKNGLAGPIAETFGGGGHANAAAYRCKTSNASAEIKLLVEAFENHKEQLSAVPQHTDSEN
jgi:phosphoesterase RecJ-like protein